MNEMLAALDAKYGLPPNTMVSLIRQESRGNVSAVSPKGARGLCQFMPGTRSEIIDKCGLDAWSKNPAEAAEAGAVYLSQQLKKYGDISKALAAYNWGTGNLDAAIKAYGPNWFAHAPTETKKYVASILGGADINDLIAFNDSMSTGGEAITTEALRRDDETRRQMLLALGMTKEQVDAMRTEDLKGTIFLALVFALVSKITNAEPVGVSPPFELPAQGQPEVVVPQTPWAQSAAQRASAPTPA